MTKINKIKEKIGPVYSYIIAKKQRLSIVVLGLVLLISLLLYMIVGQTQDISQSCSSVNRETRSTYEHSRDLGVEYEKVYEKISDSADKCQMNSKVLGIDKRETTESKLARLQYYYDKATVGYMIGKIEEAKEDAKKGLELNSKLKDKDKTLSSHQGIVKALENIRDGTY